MFKRISLLWKIFSPLEEFILNEFLRNISGEYKKITRQQVDTISKTVRYLNWNEILFYREKQINVRQYPNLQEIILASIEFNLKKIKKKWTAKIYSVNGYLFTISISPGPKKISFENEFNIISFKLIDNPMNPQENSILRRLVSILPDEYSQIEDKVINNWFIKKKTEIYSISTDLGELFCFAEKEDKYLCFSIENKKFRIFYFENHESEPRIISTNIIEAINNI